MARKNIIVAIVVLTLGAIIAILALSSYIGGKLEKGLNSFMEENFYPTLEAYGAQFVREPFRCSGISEITCRTKKIVLTDDDDAIIFSDVKLLASGGKRDAKTGLEFDFQILNVPYEKALEQDMVGKKRRVSNDHSLYGSFKCSASAHLKANSNMNMSVECNPKVENLNIKKGFNVTLQNKAFAEASDMRALVKMLEEMDEADFFTFLASTKTSDEEFFVKIKSDDVMQSFRKLFDDVDDDELQEIFSDVEMGLIDEIAHSIIQDDEDTAVSLLDKPNLIKQTFENLDTATQNKVLFLTNYLKLIYALDPSNDSAITKIDVKIKNTQDDNYLAAYLLDPFNYFVSRHKMSVLVDGKDEVLLDSKKEDEMDELFSIFDEALFVRPDLTKGGSILLDEDLLHELLGNDANE